MTEHERLARDYARKYHLYAVAGRDGKINGKTQAERLREAEAALQALLRHAEAHQ